MFMRKTSKQPLAAKLLCILYGYFQQSLLLG
jgi:hypothetical protein